MTVRTQVPVQAAAEVAGNHRAGAYRRLVLRAPAVAAGARPGQFVALAVGGPGTSMLLRRAVSVHAADAADGTVQIVLAPHGPGSRWLCERRSGDVLDVVGPLGTAYRDPAGDAVLVGGGYGSAPLVWFARRLAARRPAARRVHAVLGAADAGRLFGVEELRALGIPVTVTTDDGSAGARGRVTGALPALLAAGVDVYACGPMAMLRAVAALAPAAWCTVEESMACGIGVCMTCVLPVRGPDGVTRMARACSDGPTFAAGALRWDAIRPPGAAGSAVPADCHGAPPVAVPAR